VQARQAEARRLGGGQAGAVGVRRRLVVGRESHLVASSFELLLRPGRAFFVVCFVLRIKRAVKCVRERSPENE
jgi:hypothetical protein